MVVVVVWKLLKVQEVDVHLVFSEIFSALKKCKRNLVKADERILHWTGRNMRKRYVTGIPGMKMI